MNKLKLCEGKLTLKDLHNSIIYPTQICISQKAIAQVEKCREYLNNKLKNSEQPIYGINTGFGYLQNIKIESHQLSQLQHNLLLSHACGTGKMVPKPIVKLMLLLKIQSLSYGHSGVDIKTIKRLIDFYNNDILPVVYTQGSLGASGDLAPLAHLALPLIDEGQVYYNDEIIDSSTLNQKMGWQPLKLQSKEGLALINGTQFMSAYGVYCLIQALNLAHWANQITAMSIDAFNCRINPFLPHSHLLRPHRGQQEIAKQISKLLHGSEILSQEDKQTQDPYSFRCVPQVHGACFDTMQYVKSIFETEINAVTDNPNIFPDDDLILSAGNFHGQPLAFALDFLSIALSELGSISERRTFQLISGNRGLPPFLVKNAGLNSGLMIAQYTAASIASENKQLCTPASVDNIVSSNGQEDHVSMGANAATKCLRVVENLEGILAIELITAAQALDLRRPLKSSNSIEKIHQDFRKVVTFNESDRFLSIDISNSRKFIKDNCGVID